MKLGNMAVLAMMVGLIGVRPVLADDRETATKIVDQAIQAMGGEDRIARTKTMTRKAKGVMFPFGGEISFSTQLTIVFPDRFHDLIVLDEGMKKMARVVFQDKGWQSLAGMTVDLTKENLTTL